LVTLNRAQLAALKKLISSLDIEQMELTETLDELVIVKLIDLEDNSTSLSLDEWGQGRLHNGS